MKHDSTFKRYLTCISGLVLCAALSAYAGGGGGGGGAGGAGGAGAGAGGGGGGGGRGGSRGAPAGSQAAVRVTAVADDRANALIINASDETIKQIEDMVKELDEKMDEDLAYEVFRLTNADPSEISYQISSLFYNPATSTTQGGRGGQGGGLANSTDRAKRMAVVSTLPDPRTGALIVAASKSLMPEITNLILKLDSDPGRREVVRFFELKNSDPQDVYTSLSDLFNRSTVRMQNSANSSPYLGNNSPLTRRITTSTTSTSSAFGSSTGTGGRTGTAMTTGF
jgi:hypothetical protein